MTATATELGELLAEYQRLHEVWDHTREEHDRVRVQAAWSIGITSPGPDWNEDPLDLSRWTRCTPTVLSRDTRDWRTHVGELYYRGACLGCGWVSATDRIMGDHGENAAVEDAHDHTHPGWRELPVVAGVPSGDAPSMHKRQVEKWLREWGPLLPAGWLEAGGPIHTQRSSHGGRHVPGRAPGGGYDLGHLVTGETLIESAGGQLGLFR